MQVSKKHSAKGGERFLRKKRPEELQEVLDAIANVDATHCLRKVSSEVTMLGELLYSPKALNAHIKSYLHARGWATENKTGKRAYREPTHFFGGGRHRSMDGIKNHVGLEAQFGKYAFMGYDIFSKMIIFKNLGYIECGIEIVATSNVVRLMSSGVSEFEQLMIDFEHRGEADIDIPVLVLGLDLTKTEIEAGKLKAKRFRRDREAMYKSGEVDRPRKGTRPGP